MVIVAGTLTLDPADRAAFLEAWAVMQAATMQEDGCISYDMWCHWNDENRFQLFEEWESLEHLHAHFEVEHMQAWRAASSGLNVTDREISIYEVADKKPLG